MNSDPTLHSSDELTPTEERLNDAVEKLLNKERNPNHPLTDALGMALRLKNSQETPTLRPNFDKITERILLNEFAKPVRESFLEKFWKPMSLGLVMGGLLLTVLAPLFTPSLPDQTLAQVQEFESLTEAEVLLGTLPADAKTEDGVKIADLRSDLHELSLLRLEADLSLDEEGEPGTFPHVELRDNALELIEEEQQLLAMVEISVDINSFSEKVSEWPTTNEEVDYETHAKAVNGYITHTENWELATEAWAEMVVDNLKE